MTATFDHSFGNLPENVLDQFEWIVEDYGKLEEINQEVFIEAFFCLSFLFTVI